MNITQVYDQTHTHVHFFSDLVNPFIPNITFLLCITFIVYREKLNFSS